LKKRKKKKNTKKGVLPDQGKCANGEPKRKKEGGLFFSEERKGRTLLGLTPDRRKGQKRREDLRGRRSIRQKRNLSQGGGKGNRICCEGGGKKERGGSRKTCLPFRGPIWGTRGGENRQNKKEGGGKKSPRNGKKKSLSHKGKWRKWDRPMGGGKKKPKGKTEMAQVGLKKNKIRI